MVPDEEIERLRSMLIDFYEDAARRDGRTEFPDRVSYTQAREKGLPRYYTGIPCRRGHLAERQTANRLCIGCHQGRRSNKRPIELSSPAKRSSLSKIRLMHKTKEQQSAHGRARRARMANASGNHTADQILDLYEKQRGRCINCNQCLSGGYDVDHIMPLCRGGSNDIKNIQLLCPRCNRRKNAKDPIEWAWEQGRLL